MNHFLVTDADRAAFAAWLAQIAKIDRKIATEDKLQKELVK